MKNIEAPMTNIHLCRVVQRRFRFVLLDNLELYFTGNHVIVFLDMSTGPKIDLERQIDATQP